MKKIYLELTLIATAFLGVVANAQTFPTGFSVSQVASGWNQPVGAVANADGTKLFVWEKGGKVYVCNWNSSSQQYVKQSAPVLDISEEVGDWRDFGLLGFELDPNFNTNGLIYLLYVVDRHYLLDYGKPTYRSDSTWEFAATIGRVTRYKTNTSGSNISTDYSSRFILLGETIKTGLPILHQSHGVGSLAFAADGTLLVTHGDGACYNHTDAGSDGDTYWQTALNDGIIRANENVGAFRSQMLNSFNGKLLRLDPQTGNGISSNPFYDAANPRSAKSRVWAMGLRNPFRMSIKPNSGSTNPSTGDLGEIFIGDVGLNTWEELNIIDRPGVNMGWPLYEGHTSQPGYAAANPINRDEPNPRFGVSGCTQEFFKFGDLLKQATADNITTVFNPCNTSQAIGTGNRYFHRRPAVDWAHGNTNNARIGIFSGNNATTAVVGTAQSGVTGTSFRGNCSVGGAWYSGTAFPPEYRNAFFFGEYQQGGGNGLEWMRVAKLKTSDGLESVNPFGSNLNALVFIGENPLNGGELICIEYGNNTSPVKRIVYGGSLPPIAKVNADKIFGPSALDVVLNSNGSLDPEGGVLTYLWDFGDNTTSTESNPPPHIFTAPPNTPRKFVIKLTVKDNANLSATDSIIISVNNTPPKVNIISPVKNSRYRVDQPVPDTLYRLEAVVSDLEHTDAQLSYEWQTYLRHNEHEHAEAIDKNKITSSMISRIGCNGDTYYFMIKLKVTDAAGLSTEDSAKIFPRCPGDISLPVTLSSFSVNNTDDVNLVKWATEAQENNEHFELERSTDGKNFEKIFVQEGKNGTGVMQYSFPDKAYQPGINYYRLKMVEIDGIHSYSKIVKVTNGLPANADLRINPNPAVKAFTLTTYFPERGPITIRIIDVSGKVVKQISDNVDKGAINLQINQLEKLKPGTYFLELKQGDYMRKTKFVKVD